MNRILALLLISLSFYAVGEEINDATLLLRHTETLSRDHFYLHFDENGRYQKQNIIGGEHQTGYHILGFEDDVYQMTVTSLEGEAMYSLSGDGYQHKSNSDAPNSETITVLYQDLEQPSTWITIWISAHPYAKYTITVDKL